MTIDTILAVLGYVVSAGVFLVVSVWRLSKMFVTKNDFNDAVKDIEDTIKSQGDELKQHKTSHEVLKAQIDGLQRNIEVMLDAKLNIFSKDIEGIVSEVKHLNGNVKQSNENQAKVMEKLIRQEEASKQIVEQLRHNSDKINEYDTNINSFYKEYGAGLEWAKKQAVKV